MQTALTEAVKLLQLSFNDEYKKRNHTSIRLLQVITSGLLIRKFIDALLAMLTFSKP